MTDNGTAATASELLDGRFELTAEVRSGGMAQVYKARDRWSDGNYCAIKRMLPLADVMLAKESFQREFKALEMLQHKNIVRMITCGVGDDRRPYIAMEWVESDLEKHLEERSGPMEWSEFWYRIGRPLLDALSLSQSRRWVHRDLKPAAAHNLLVG
jgi:serine/threonine protein kinase